MQNKNAVQRTWKLEIYKFLSPNSILMIFNEGGGVNIELNYTVEDLS